MVATLPNQVVGAKNHLRLFLWILMGSILFYAVLAIFWHALRAQGIDDRIDGWGSLLLPPCI